MGKDNRIYEFVFKDAWGEVLHGFRLLDNSSVQLIGNNELSDLKYSKPIIIPEDITGKIKNIIKDSDEVFRIKNRIVAIEVLDGYKEDFFINNGKEQVEINSLNIYCCDEDDKAAAAVIGLHEKVANLLIAQGFEEKHFLLYPPREYRSDDILDLEEALSLAIECEPTIDNCLETKDAFIFRFPELYCSEGPQAIVVLKKGGKTMLLMEYMLHKEELGLDPEDDVTVAEHDFSSNKEV